MHTQTQLKLGYFGITVDGRPADADSLLPGWHRHDRFGLVIHDALGGVGASHLLQIAICAYYNADDRRRSELTVYPEIYAFHIGGGHGSHADYDFWGPRRQVLLGDDPDEVLAAINERGITRLAVPDTGAPVDDAPAFEPKEVGAFHDLVASAFAYSPTGRTPGSDVEIAGLDRRTEENPRKVLSPFTIAPPPRNPGKARRPLKEVDVRFDIYQQQRAAELTEAEVDRAASDREKISHDGVATEAYRRISRDEALLRLVHR